MQKTQQNCGSRLLVTFSFASYLLVGSRPQFYLWQLLLLLTERETEGEIILYLKKINEFHCWNCSRAIYQVRSTLTLDENRYLEEDEKRKCFREATEAGVRWGKETSLGGIPEVEASKALWRSFREERLWLNQSPAPISGTMYSERRRFKTLVTDWLHKVLQISWKEVCTQNTITLLWHHKWSHYITLDSPCPISCFRQSLVFWGDFNDLMLSLVNETILLRKRNALPDLGTSCQVWDVFPAYRFSLMPLAPTQLSSLLEND